VCANVAYLSRFFGLDQGFGTYLVPQGGWYAWQPAGFVFGRKLSTLLAPGDWEWRLRRWVSGIGRYYLMAPEVNRLALHWLRDRKDRRFFLFLNYMDAHAPYLPVGRYRDLFPAAGARQRRGRKAAGAGGQAMQPIEHDAIVDAYDAEIRYLDDHLGELFATLRGWGLLDNTVVVVVGDHGESFGEHGEFEHATGLHEPQLRVPLIVRAPGQTEGDRVPRIVHLVDVMPTVLELLGLALPPDLQASSLTSADRPQPVTAHLGRYGRDYTEDAIYEDPWKLIVSSAGGVELFDLRSDPGERRNLAWREADTVGRLAGRLRRFKEKVTPRFDRLDTRLDRETLERLEALGYLD
jgi:arylsulfatase A-like enzyme